MVSRRAEFQLIGKRNLYFEVQFAPQPPRINYLPSSRKNKILGRAHGANEIQNFGRVGIKIKFANRSATPPHHGFLIQQQVLRAGRRHQ